MLTDGQLIELAKRMDIPLERVCFKDELKDQPLKYNVGYIINLENALDENGDQNEGSHWTAFTVRKYKNDKIEPIYFDSYGKPPPEEVKLFVDKHLPFTTKDIQSLMGNVCGYYCLAFLYWIYSFKDRSGNLYEDVENFLDLFLDLNLQTDYLYNEYALKLFFKTDNGVKHIVNFKDWK